MQFRTISAAAILAAAACWAAPASAQSMRTWVMGTGDDVNPCSRTSPCKTFAGAASKTATNGEINCIDSGAYGAVTITRSIAIVCDQQEAGVLVSGAGVSGVTIQGSGTRVLLSGLDINGYGVGQNGITVAAGASVVIRNTTIQGFAATGSRGVSVEGPVDVVIKDSTIVNNTTGIANPGNGTIRVGNTLIRGNTTGLSGAVGSFGTNQLDGNGTNGKFGPTVPQS